MNIMQISTADVLGGAEKVALRLFRAYHQRGHNSRLVVGWRRGVNRDVELIPNRDTGRIWSRLAWRLEARLHPHFGRVKGIGYLDLWLRRILEPENLLDWYVGREQFHYPGSWQLLNTTSAPPDILHVHNLHGGYFDLRVLPTLSQRVPLVMTLHDAWLFSGHCAHSFDCTRWLDGCGQCPDLTIYPAIRRDATGENWLRKRDVFSRSRLHVATPSRWLMDKAQRSMLAEGVVAWRVIPNGVDLTVFHPADRSEARQALGLPSEAMILMFAANGMKKNNPWRDYDVLRSVIASLADRPLVFLAVGEAAPPQRVGSAEIRFVPFLDDSRIVARCFQAADAYLHAARVDTFPNVVIEALACGTPVVATAVGGIPEQIDDGQTGFLTPPGEANAMVRRVRQLLADDALRHILGRQATDVATQRFDMNRQVNDYLDWYEDLYRP
jgi:glycosyltransferase involved in cell wall biosynthesis